MQYRFMQSALLGLILLAPMVALMGVQVVNFRLAFFTDAISHSAFTGIALGLILGINPQISIPVFGVLIGIGVMYGQRRSNLSHDAVIGVIFSAVVALGIAIVSREKNLARNVQRFMYGDILTINVEQLMAMGILLLVVMLFHLFSFNRLIALGINPVLAKAHRIKVDIYRYIFASLLALVVVYAVNAVGVFLVTALLIVPASAARNFASTAGAMVWWAILIALSSSIAGLLISSHPVINTATGATVVIVSFIWFGLSFLRGILRREK